MAENARNLPSFIASLESSLDFVYSDGGVTPVASGTSTGWRTMPWLLTTYLENGVAHAETEHGDVLDYGDGCVCCVAPGVRHRIDAVQGGVSWWSHYSFRVAGGLSLTDFIDMPLILSGQEAARIKLINGELAQVGKRGGDSVALLLRAKALGFDLASVLTSCANPRADRIALIESAFRLQPVLRHIEGHMDGDLSRDTLARLASLSPSRFYVVFHAALGTGPNQYVLRRRMEHAQQILITTDLSVSEVGMRCGYDDPFLFSRMFKRLHGLSPLQYRGQVKASFG